ncbi:MAG: glycine--tRNA ligase [Deltaproteobacteria bacterium]|nr:glycine--tRNA ligase [Deltaproteobacteria bacterium]
MQELVSLCKRRGFIFQSSEIYGGLGSCWDYGPLGVELKLNIKRLWWEEMTSHPNIVGIDASILMHHTVWEASGHVEGFNDLLVDCKACKQRFRPDDLTAQICPSCGGELTSARKFNLMFKTFMGPVEDEANIVYLRPETAQGIYVNFHNVVESARLKVPCGLAQIGKAFRNEITPGNFIFRTREFEQMEMQYFVRPGDDEKVFEEWLQSRFDWYARLGIDSHRIRLHEHMKDELAHYAKKAMDIQFEFPFGWQEIEGIHNRTDFDLARHQQYSRRNLEYFDVETNAHYIPYVIETSAGCDRALLATLLDAYSEEEVRGEKRVYLKFPKAVAPVEIAFFPLLKKDPLIEAADKLFHDFRRRYRSMYDDAGSIGRRYRRQDEVGTPFCVTVDFQSLEDQKVTVRDRDTMEQDRVAMDRLAEYFEDKFAHHE